MNPRYIPILLALLTVIPLHAAGDESRTETQDYTGAGWVDSACTIERHYGIGHEVTSNCFVIEPGETTIDVTAHDVTGLDVSVRYWFWHHNGEYAYYDFDSGDYNGAFCGAAQISVPDWLREAAYDPALTAFVHIRTFPSSDPLCPQGVAGSFEATFS